MGIGLSTRLARGKGSKTPNVKPSEQVQNYEDVELMLLKRTIARDPETFVLNNLMMCLQFFENYEEDILRIKETLASTYEAKLNKVLPAQKHVLLPDVLQEYIAPNIAFTSKRQTGDLIIEPLQPVRIYIVHDNIEITEQHYLPEYSSLNNTITYTMMVQQSDHRGYVRLRRLDETPYPRNSRKKESIDPSSTADDDEKYDGDSESTIYGPNSNMTLPDHIKKSGLQTTTIFNVRSLPNLQDDETIYEDQVSLSHENIYGTRSNHDIKIESDCEHMSSIEDQRAHGKKPWLKSELEARKGSYQRYPRSDSAKLMKTKVCRPPSSSSSGYRSGAGDSDSDWGYHSVTSNVASSRNVNHDNTTADAPTKIYSNTMIPTECFKKVRINNEGRIYTARQDRKQPQNSKQFRLMMADRQYDCDVFYTSSETFMNHFVELFVNQLAKPLGFESEDLNHVQDSVIYCDKVINSHTPRLRRIESYEITPTIWLQWPEDAQEWLDRPRSTWPDYNDINKVKDFGCYVVPEDSIPRKRNSARKDSRHNGAKKIIDHEIEWQLIFPAAERYLETCMTHSQVQVYLIALMLHKTFLRPVLDTMYGLTISHIRNKLFWLIEENDRPSKWPDNRTGECLLKLLHSLYHCISQNDPILPDYFVRDKNMFTKVPNDYLLHSQKQLKRIMENPIMYVFHAMENIRHSDKFFPRLDFTMLFKILTVKPWLAVVNPALDMFMPSSKAAEEAHMAREEIYNKSGEFWMSAKMRSQQTYSTRVVTNRTLITPRKATYSIVEITEHCAELEGPRLAALLDFFVRHFIKMAECCHRYRAYQQKQVYLDQADRLSIILSEVTRYKDDAKAYRDKIYALRMRPTTNSTMRLQNEPPETPKRNLEPIYVGSLKERFTRQAAEILTPPKNEQSSREEHAESSRENHASEISTKAIVHEVRFKDEKAETSSANAQAKTTETITSNNEVSLRKLASKDQSNESASNMVQRVVSLTDNLSETTYI